MLGSNIVEESSKTLERNLSTSSLEFFHSQQQEEIFLDIHTSLFSLEHLLQELFAKGEENLARQLTKFYIASHNTSFPLE